jgi:hypothetical protein
MVRKDKPSRASSVAKKSAKAPARTRDDTTKNSPVAVELERLRAILRSFPALSAEEAQAFDERYTEAQYRATGADTRAVDVFRGAMAWARIVGDRPEDRALSPKPVRWFLDCLYALGLALEGTVLSGNPSFRSQLDAVESEAKKLIARTEGRVRRALGGREAYLEQLDATRTFDGMGNAVAQRARKLAALCHAWLGGAHRVAALPLLGVDEETVRALEAMADDIDAIVRKTPAARESPNDSPALNVIEGRLLRAMRLLWDEADDAREQGSSKLVFTVTPALLRGLNVRPHKKNARPTEP